MSATVISDPMVISGEVPESQPPSSQSEVEFIICNCCSLTEECTPAYIERVRERYFGKWICGLCAEAIKDEIVRSKRLISTEEAMKIHMNFCNKFKTADPPTDPSHGHKADYDEEFGVEVHTEQPSSEVADSRSCIESIGELLPCLNGLSESLYNQE